MQLLRTLVATTCFLPLVACSGDDESTGGTGGSYNDASQDSRDVSSGKGGGSVQEDSGHRTDVGLDVRGRDGEGRDSRPDLGLPDTSDPDAECTPVVVASAVDPWQMRLAGGGFGGIETVSSGGHNDVYLKSPDDQVRIGARLDWGGTIVFFGLSANPSSNTIDANDTGRELQIALYDPSRIRQPCAWNASCETSTDSCGNSITFLGWDPVQGGDECGHGSPSSWSQQGDALRLTVQPMQWNPDWDKPDCTQSPCGAQGVPVQVTYVMDIRFLTPLVVEVATEIQSQESIDHPATGQEFPTLYVGNGSGGTTDLPLLLDSAGSSVGLNTPGNDGFYYDNFSSPGPWVTWQHANQDYGVAIAMDQGITQWQGWRGDGQTAPYFHNVRAQIAFGLGAGGSVRGISYLGLGSFATVQSSLNTALATRAPFGTMDSPAAGSTITQTAGQPLHVAGWVLDAQAIASVQVSIDGGAPMEAPVNLPRADVCATYPAYAGCPNAGFEVDLATTDWDTCPHLIRVTATDPQGNSSVLGEASVQMVP